MNIYEEIKDRVSMAQVIRKYGFEPNHSQFIKCPFHAEDTASMRIYDKSFYCFGCQVGGDVIKFVSLYCNIGSLPACYRLNDDFNLNLLGKNHRTRKPTKDELEHRQQKIKEEQELKEYRQKYIKLSNEYNRLRKIQLPLNDNQAMQYAQDIARLEYLEYWLEENKWR